MDKFWWHAARVLCLLQLSLAQIDLNITCRFAGVFHVEKNGRYSISRTEAADLCKAFNSTLPTMAQMEKALSIGFETCRYGFIEGHVVIPRIQPNSICGANTTSGPVRTPQIPEWLIILASLLALALILAVCIAVNSRRRCGQKKKLVINSGNGAVDDRKPSGLNGEASKSQEMVHLVNKEPSETPDQFMTADETRNLQNVDMKIGV
uniref:CD44 antigen n=1 Tax=Theropithecus gelada TaxID=9565 RepID=A0A8D2JVK3_THEGE